MRDDHTLLSESEFIDSVLKADDEKCVNCRQHADCVHHILDPRLFGNSGNYLSNGVSLCIAHKILALTTELTCKELRDGAGIKNPILPEHFYHDEEYDAWGNIILKNGQRLKGELFNTDKCQEFLSSVNLLGVFTSRVKYPRTMHCPFSESLGDDDKMHPDMSFFEGKEVVVTEKMDGENTTLYHDYLHARSLDSKHHPSRDWVKSFWSTIKMDIPTDWRICGENLFAEHSIAYDSLPTYFLGFSVWNERNVCLSWDDTMEWFSMIGITPVPILYRGVYDEEKIRSLFDQTERDRKEGYVIRLASSFSYGGFKHSVAKFVRKNHVKSGETHWMHRSDQRQNKLSE